MKATSDEEAAQPSPTTESTAESTTEPLAAEPLMAERKRLLRSKNRVLLLCLTALAVLLYLITVARLGQR